MSFTEIKNTNHIRNEVRKKNETEDKIKEIQSPNEYDKWAKLVDFGTELS